MIPQAYITAWRTHAPWPNNEQVEQDLLISRGLLEIFSHPQLKGKLAFRGGTALDKLHLVPAARYSEDIDLVQIKAGPIGPILDELRSSLHFLGDAKSNTAENVATLTYRMDSEIQPVVRLRLKIEINGREHFAVRGWQRHPFSLVSDYAAGVCEITTYTVEELLATKLRALYQRRKGRDLFDLYYAGLHMNDLDYSGVAATFTEYMRQAGHEVPTRSQFMQNLEMKLHHPDFTGDTTALLRPDIEFDYAKAFARVARDVLSHLADT